MPDPKTSAVSENRSATLGLVMALVLIVVAYYPTLVENFAPQDQWRAFRYSLEPGLPGDRYDACFNTTIKFYFLTGRWLVWIGECIEHSAVAQIKDFTPLRVIVLGVVLLSAIIFRKVLTGVINCPRLAIVPAVMATLLPGYAFMYYQGLTGLPVLLAFPLALLSFHFISPALTEKIEGNTTYGLVMGGIFFLSACFIYPVFAFTVIPTAFIFSAFRPEISLGKRISLCARFCAYYLVVSIIYFLMVKSGITVAEHLGKSIPDLKNYRFDILTDSGELINKLGIVFHELTHMPLASFLNVPAWLCLTILLGPAGIMFYEGERLNWGRTLSILAVVLYALSIPAIAVASVFPWFLSHTLGDVYRHMLPIHFLLILSFGILVTRGIEKLKLIYGELSARRIESTILVVLVSIFSINQISLSQLQVFDSTIEINHMRDTFNEMITNGKFWDLKEVHIVRPEIGRHYNGRPIDREFIPATMANPEHILQMTHAVLREMLSPEQLRQVHLIDCRFDRNCSESAPKNVLVISQSEYGTPLPALRKNHVIINYSHLNNKSLPVKAITDIKGRTSSQLEFYSHAYIFSEASPYFWHAEQNERQLS